MIYFLGEKYEYTCELREILKTIVDVLQLTAEFDHLV